MVLAIRIGDFYRSFFWGCLVFGLKCLELFAGVVHEGLEARVGMETGHGGTGGEAAGVDIALPVEAGDDAALAVAVADGEDGIGAVGAELGEEQGGAPSEDGVARRIGAVVPELFLVAGDDGGLAEEDIGAGAHIMLLGQFAHLVGGHHSDGNHLIDGGGAFAADGDAQRLTEDAADVVDAPHGVADGNGAAFGVLALLEAPAVLRLVVLEGGTGGVGRRRQEVHSIGHGLLGNKWGLREGNGYEAEGEDDECENLFHEAVRIVFIVL